MSRLRIFVLFAALVALATALAACGGGGGGSSSEDPQKVIQNATFEGVKSGNVDLSFGFKAEGKEGGDLNVEVSGPFQSAGKEALPEFDLAATAKGSVQGEDVNFEGGLTLLSDRAFVGFEGTEYEVDPTTFGFLKSTFEQAQQQGAGEKEGATGCQEAAMGLEVEDFLTNLSNEGETDVAGTSTTKVSGDLNVEGSIDQITKLLESPACRGELEAAGPLPLGQLEEAKKELSSAIKEAHVDVYVGEDHLVRRLAANVTVEPKGSGERVDIEFDVTLSEVNEPQSIKAPANAKPLEGLFKELGVNPLELLEGGGAGGLGGLLEGLGGGELPGGGSGGSSGGGSSGGVPKNQQAYIECLQGAQTPADLQKCASLLQ